MLLLRETASSRPCKSARLFRNRQGSQISSAGLKSKRKLTIVRLSSHPWIVTKREAGEANSVTIEYKKLRVYSARDRSRFSSIGDRIDSFAGLSQR